MKEEFIFAVNSKESILEDLFTIIQEVMHTEMVIDDNLGIILELFSELGSLIKEFKDLFIKVSKDRETALKIFFLEDIELYLIIGNNLCSLPYLFIFNLIKNFQKGAEPLFIGKVHILLTLIYNNNSIFFVTQLNNLHYVFFIQNTSCIKVWVAQ